MLSIWSGPHGGLPPWDALHPHDFQPLFEDAIADALAEFTAIVDQHEAPTFDNTIVALERVGRPLKQLRAMFRVHCRNLGVGDMPEIEHAIRPLLVAYDNQVSLNQPLFARIDAIYQQRHSLDSEAQRLVEKRYDSYRRAGANLPEAEKAQLAELNQQLASLETAFRQNLTKAQCEFIWIANESLLSGLSSRQLQRFKEHATALDRPDEWAIKNSASVVGSVLRSSSNRQLRQQVWSAYRARAATLGALDNRPLVEQILSLRWQRAKLLGYDSHAHYQLEQRMAKHPDTAIAFLTSMWDKSLSKAKRELDELLDYAATADGLTELRPWDISHYSERLKQEKYEVDSSEVSQYFQLDNMVQALHMVAKEVFGLRFEQLHDAPVFHPDVTLYRVCSADNPAENAPTLGLWYLDPYARDGKKSGAWNTSYRTQEHIDYPVLPIYANNCNLSKPDPGKLTLIHWRQARTLFHEFGHALHGLCSKVRFPSLAGTRVSRDFVEFPSQLLESWLFTDRVLNQHALHHSSGEPLPAALLQRLRDSATYNSGITMVQYLSTALLDLRVHLLEQLPGTVESVEQQFRAELGMPDALAMRFGLAQFQHIFSSSYAAGYYSYRWADALTADAAEYFAQQPQGFYDRALAKTLVESVLSVGDTIPPEQAFAQFRGRDVDSSALLRKLGLE